MCGSCHRLWPLQTFHSGFPSLTLLAREADLGEGLTQSLRHPVPPSSPVREACRGTGIVLLTLDLGQKRNCYLTTEMTWKYQQSLPEFFGILCLCSITLCLKAALSSCTHGLLCRVPILRSRLESRKKAPSVFRGAGLL